MDQEKRTRITLEATNAGRLLPGEDPTSVDPDDVKHWVAVYEELLSGKRAIISALRANLENSGFEARREMETIDMPLFEAQLDRFETRLDFWRSKR